MESFCWIKAIKKNKVYFVSYFILLSLFGYTLLIPDRPKIQLIIQSMLVLALIFIKISFLYSRDFRRVLNINVVILILFFAVSEIFLIFFGNNVSDQNLVSTNSKLGWSFIPHKVVSGVDGNGEQYQIEINSLGLRGPEPKSHQPSIKVYLGDSVTMANHIPFRKTFAYLTGAMNAGVSGYSTYQQSEFYQYSLKHLTPQVLVLIVCVNDAMSVEDDAKIRESFKNRHEGPAQEKGGFPSLGTVIKSSQLFSFIASLDDRLEIIGDLQYEKLVREEKSEAVWLSWIGSVLEIKKALPLDSKFYMVLAPARVQVKLFKQGETTFAFNQKFAALCEKFRLECLDALPSFGEADVNLFVDKVHLNEAGHLKMASVISDFIEVETSD